MSESRTRRPFPDYVTCPYCGEPEVEVWCYATSVHCHACEQVFQHALPLDCASQCDRVACESEPPHTPIKFS
jgi:hypothetical protein